MEVICNACGARVEFDGGVEAEMRRQRDLLGQAIGEAALKAGCYNGEVNLTGPQLMLLIDDMADGLNHFRQERDRFLAAICTKNVRALTDIAAEHGDSLNVTPHEGMQTEPAVVTPMSGNDADLRGALDRAHSRLLEIHIRSKKETNIPPQDDILAICEKALGIGKGRTDA